MFLSNIFSTNLSLILIFQVLYLIYSEAGYTQIVSSQDFETIYRKHDFVKIEESAMCLVRFLAISIYNKYSNQFHPQHKKCSICIANFLTQVTPSSVSSFMVGMTVTTTASLYVLPIIILPVMYCRYVNNLLINSDCFRCSLIGSFICLQNISIDR